jgi:hypothetical protein
MKREIINRPAIQQDQLHDFLVRLADYQGDKVVAAGIKFLTLIALCPRKVIHIKWTDIDVKTMMSGRKLTSSIPSYLVCFSSIKGICFSTAANS